MPPDDRPHSSTAPLVAFIGICVGFVVGLAFGRANIETNHAVMIKDGKVVGWE